MTRLIVVDRDGRAHDIDAKPGARLMEILRELDYGVAAICGGLCSCATCNVYVEPSWAERLPPPPERRVRPSQGTTRLSRGGLAIVVPN